MTIPPGTNRYYQSYDSRALAESPAGLSFTGCAAQSDFCCTCTLYHLLSSRPNFPLPFRLIHSISRSVRISTPLPSNSNSLLPRLAFSHLSHTPPNSLPTRPCSLPLRLSDEPSRAPVTLDLVFVNARASRMTTYQLP
jgi:hypothetical protein